MKTKPELFIIESLRLEDEEDGLKEGEMIAKILQFAGKKKTRYFYIRTKKELSNIADLFAQSTYRYIHFSMHSDQKNVATTFDVLTNTEFCRIFSPKLKNKRVFVSGCSMANENLASGLLKNSGCYSLVGPAKEIGFDDAAAFWVAFYHLMFKYNFERMHGRELHRYAFFLSKIFEEPVNYFRRSKSEKGFVKVPMSVPGRADSIRPDEM